MSTYENPKYLSFEIYATASDFSIIPFNSFFLCAGKLIIGIIPVLNIAKDITINS